MPVLPLMRLLPTLPRPLQLLKSPSVGSRDIKIGDKNKDDDDDGGGGDADNRRRKMHEHASSSMTALIITVVVLPAALKVEVVRGLVAVLTWMLLLCLG
mmetsp:Transcript_14190/g.19706  ORF Transcript_14190/g.19706 Transcript_14190/m.19706 type:complete len:99 (-) Transcript_14190:269-565(-)